MNKVVLIGRLTKDPELRFTPGSGAAVTTLTLAVDRYNPKTNQNEADFIPIVIWGKQAENTANYMSKGGQVAISGKIQTRSYEAKDGTKRYITEVVADQFNGVQFLGNKNGGVENQDNGSNNYGGMNQDVFGGGYDDPIRVQDDGEMPF
ncbi:single-stranded DNA-binding protein [Clostridium butyricum]